MSKKGASVSATNHSVPGREISWFVFGLMASVTFVGLLSELVPSGLLPQMSDGLGVSEPQVGFLVGVYALASALCALPLVSATLAVNRKRLLLVLLVGCAASSIIVALAASCSLIIASGTVAGICPGGLRPWV